MHQERLNWQWYPFAPLVLPCFPQYKKSMDDDFAFEEEKGEQKGGPKTSKVDQKLERPFCNLYPRTQVSLRAKWPTDWISTGVLYLSISRGCKTTTWFVAKGHRSLVAGLSYNKKKCIHPIRFHCYIVTLLRLGCRGRAQRPRRLYQEPQLLEVSEDEAEEGRKRTG